MKIETKKNGGCRIELKVELDQEELSGVVKGVENAFAKNVTIPGFRRGKAPMDIVRRNFAREIAVEKIQAMVSRYYPKAIKEKSISEVDLVELKDTVCEGDSGGFTAVVDVEPEFKLPQYKGLKIAPANIDVKDSDVEERITQMRQYYATYEDAPEGYAVADGDYVQVDYEGTIDGKPVLEVDPDAKMVAGMKGYWFCVREGYFLPELIDAVKGMKAGEAKEGIKVKFDKKAAPEKIAGKKAVYTMTVLSVRNCVLPDDAALAAKAEAESFGKLAEDVRKSLEKQAEESERVRRENEAYDLILKKADFDIPASVVARQKDSLIKMFIERAGGSNIDAKFLESKRAEIDKDAQENAEKQVRFYYIAKAIVKEEDIKCDPGECGSKAVEFIVANAKSK